jgi:peptidyl-prolyl cis-trans isomerase SurA
MIKAVRLFLVCEVCVLALALLGHQANAADPQVIDGVAAIVNGDIITFSQVQDVSGPREQSLRQQFQGQDLVVKIKEVRLAALNDLIDRQLILQEFKKKQADIPAHYVDDEVTRVIKDEFAGDRQAFIRTLNAQGYTINKFRDVQRDKMIVEAMRMNNVKDVSTPSEPQIDAYYKTNHQEFATPEQIKLRIIVLNSDPSDLSSGQSTMQMANEIRDKVKGGADFGALAKTYSMDSTAENGGDWGWVDQKTLNQQLTATAFALQPGQVSDPVQIGDSYYLLFCEAKKPSTFIPLDQVRDTIRKKLQGLARQKATQKWIDGLREKAYIKVF